MGDKVRTFDLGDVRHVLPPAAETEIELGLVELTRALTVKLGTSGSGGLGGEYGYGQDFENEVFMMHSYCWCEREDCPWCGGCECPESAFHYYVDGKEVTFNEWQDFFDRQAFDVLGIPHSIVAIPDGKHEEWMRLAREANKRRGSSCDGICDYHQGKGVFSTHGSLPGRGAPNFWHKPSGFRAWWYKWIGRDTEYNMEITGVGGQAILSECLESLVAE